MGASVVLYRGIEKTINSRGKACLASTIDGSDPAINEYVPVIEEMKDKIGDLFIKSGFMLPEDLMEDLYQYYLDTGIGSGSNDILEPNQLRELAYHLVDVIDLFDMDYDEAEDPLVLDEWVTIKNLFSSYAEDIDDDLLTYVMRYAIEKGAFQ